MLLEDWTARQRRKNEHALEAQLSIAGPDKVLVRLLREQGVTVSTGAAHEPQEETSGPPPTVSRTDVGNARIKVHVTATERADLERRAAPGETAGTYLRRAMLETIRLARPVGESPSPSGPTRTVEFRCDSHDVEALDRARGPASRNAYLRALLFSH